MNLFDVYPLFNIELEKGLGSYVWDTGGRKYLDLYGGHAVISIGHAHPHYVKAITTQLGKLGFYSNFVQIPLQQELAGKLGGLSGCGHYNLFLCNSGAEANENALKAASFHNGRKKVIAFSKGFHGRTSLAVALTDNPSIVAPVNRTDNAAILPLNDEHALEEAMLADEVCAVIVEGIQGVGGVHAPSGPFLHKIRTLCNETGALMILDEVQSGCGRSGRFFAFQHAGVEPDIITVAKGMGNGFPIGGVLLHPRIEAKHGMLGTTFGGNHLACAAAIAVLDVIRDEGLMENAARIGALIASGLEGADGIVRILGKGLMIGIELDVPCAPVRKKLLEEHRIFTGSSSDKNTIRILPALNIGEEEAGIFLGAFRKVLTKTAVP